MFSKACEYGIKATLFIAQESNHGNRASLKDIADAIDSPESFTAKILQKLVQQDIILSKKGPHGGFFTDPDHNKKLSEIVKAIDGDNIYQGCALGFGECSEDHPCPLHSEFLGIRNEFKGMLENTTVQDLVEKIELGQSFLKSELGNFQ
ncbi:transcriptional regulator [Christiangramia fulva]|uniref:Transcriptional regulator n=1 Tax=Christiangramia fulva TaxID=2126553 RepID=A0A2R3ZAI3_9FLAO|nr:Rrf2 family transcriptional regulator [Christiangramia fulva]AVR47313.1 transcriptional regulator [Christiangramia fulva]